MKYRVLRLTSPNMVGHDIKHVQEHLNLSAEVPAGVLADGIYGKATGSAVLAWQYRMGFPRDRVTTALGVAAQAIMFREKDESLPATFQVRRLARQKLGWKPGWGIPKYRPDLGEAALGYGGVFVGKTEQPPGSNVIPVLVSEGRRLGVGSAGMGYPFCGYFFFLCSLAVGGEAAHLGLIKGRFNALYTPAIEAEARANRSNLMIVGASQARPGDGALFNWDGNEVDHVGRIKAISGGLVTLEGNTSFGPGGSQSNGGAIAVRTDRRFGPGGITVVFRELS